MVTVTMQFDGVDGDVKMSPKQADEIECCRDGAKVSLKFRNGDVANGIFCGIDEDFIMLKSFKSPRMIGLPVDKLDVFLEEDDKPCIPDIAAIDSTP